jgi:hypothetical protein
LDLTRAEPRAFIATILRVQADWCERLGSSLYASLLLRAAEDAEAGGPVWAVMSGREKDPLGSALALRFVGAVHRVVLEGNAPDLAAYYPSVGGDVAGDAWPAFRAAVEANVDALRALIDLPVQTNEVGRSAALIGGFLRVGRGSGLPLRVLEIGSSAGLNLRWDRYRYESGAWEWGDPASPVRFTDVFVDATPELAEVTVAERAGCDPSPIDASTENGRLTLMSYTWPDQTRRFEQMRAALEVAARVPATVDRADGPSWLGEQLARARPGLATVVFHSIVTQYLEEDGRARLTRALDEAALRATAEAPLAWLRLEPTQPEGAGRFLVHLTTWPGGEEVLLAEAHPHGPPVHWLGSG